MKIITKLKTQEVFIREFGCVCPKCSTVFTFNEKEVNKPRKINFKKEDCDVTCPDCAFRISLISTSITEFTPKFTKEDFVTKYMEEKKKRDRYRRIELPVATNISEAVDILTKYNERGVYVYTEFNGVVLYSDTVTLDSAYKDIIGMTKEEFDNKEKERVESLKREREEYESKIPKMIEEWIEKGHEILEEKYWSIWDEKVPISIRDLYRGAELKCTLDIVSALNNGCSLEEAKEMIENQGHSGMSFLLVKTMVGALCSRGEEFFKFVD